ncbi:MAG: glutamate racemase [Clostridia bacterium]|nr:glutamate racemase [Clostridia bacterium]
MSDKSRAIGVFDSGLGGLTAIKQLKRILPSEHFIYFGDTGRVPYGTRSFETVIQYADDDMRFLMSFDIKAAVVACGTVSAVALPSLEKKFSLPIIGAISPACHAASKISKNKKIAVFATPATISKNAYNAHLNSIDPEICIFPVACPMFVPLIECGYISKDSHATRIIAAEYLSKLCGTGADTLILGCTHYPIISELISSVSKEVLGYEINIIDSGLEAAYATKTLLEEKDLLNTETACGKVDFYVSDETQNFKNTASIFLGEQAENVTKVSIG